MRYYHFIYWDSRGGGFMFILSDSERKARKRLRQLLNSRRPFRRYRIRLENVMPA